MIDKNNIKDTALVAVMQHHGFSHSVNPDGSYRVRVADDEFEQLLAIYRLQYRPVLLRIKRLRKDLQT